MGKAGCRIYDLLSRCGCHHAELHSCHGDHTSVTIIINPHIRMLTNQHPKAKETTPQLHRLPPDQRLPPLLLTPTSRRTPFSRMRHRRIRSSVLIALVLGVAKGRVGAVRGEGLGGGGSFVVGGFVGAVIVVLLGEEERGRGETSVVRTVVRAEVGGVTHRGRRECYNLLLRRVSGREDLRNEGVACYRS